MSDPSNVVQIGCPMRVVERIPRSALVDCQHLGVEIDELERAVTCIGCGKRLDPFAYLLILANDWERRANWARHRERAADEYVAKKLARNERRKLKKCQCPIENHNDVNPGHECAVCGGMQ